MGMPEQADNKEAFMSEEKWKCPNCGTENAADDNFCGECGGKKPEVGIGIAQTVNNQETTEKKAAINEPASEKPKKKGVGKIVLILLVICVLAAACIMVIDAQEKVRIAEQQRIEKEREEAERRENIRRHQCESADRLFPCKDNSTGLFWSSRAPKTMKWGEAKKYCENLSEGLISAGWRLPTIDELRTLVKDRKTVTGGACKVSEKNRCLSSEYCWSWKTCAEACKGSWKSCSSYYDGRYSKLDDGGDYWSSSTPSGIKDSAWGVGFYSGDVNYSDKTRPSNVRCVR